MEWKTSFGRRSGKQRRSPLVDLLEKISNAFLIEMLVSVMLHFLVSALILNTFLYMHVLSFIFMWSRSVLLFIVLIVMVSIVETVNSMTAVFFKDRWMVYSMVLMMDLIFPFMRVVGIVIRMKVWIVEMIVLEIMSIMME